jgi:ElaB/YqjD/DUF883 family membrane-anchored ribosome-binding protein
MKIDKDMKEKLKNQIQKQLSLGKEKLTWLENQISDEKNHKTLQLKLEEARKKVAHLRETYNRFEKKAVDYTEKNPKKALAIASVAGILAASLWNAFQKKKTSSPPEPARKTKKSPVKTAGKTNKKTAVSKP